MADADAITGGNNRSLGPLASQYTGENAGILVGISASFILTM